MFRFALSAFVVYFARVTMGLLLLPLDAPEERDEVFCDLVLLVLEGDGALAVVGLDAIIPEAGVDEAGLHRLLCRRGDVCAGVVVFPQYADPV